MTSLALNSIDLSRAIPPTPSELSDGLQYVLAQLAIDPSISARLRRNRIGGAEADRAAGAAWLARRLGSRPSIDRVAVANGTQSLLGLLLYHCVGSGSTILAEELTYPVLVPLAQRYGVRVVPVAIDAEGLIPNAFEDACKKPGVKAIFCNPTVHNPTTSVLPHDRRMQIVSIAREYGVAIIEDDVLGPLHGPSPSPMACFGPDIVWYIQSLSKCAALGLKIAYLVGPSAKQVHEVVHSVSSHSFWFPSALSAEVATRLIETGRAQEICDAIGLLAERRQAIARRAFHEVTFQGAPGGLHIWIPLPLPLSAGEFVSKASAAGIQIRPAEMFAVRDGDLSRRIPEAVRVAVTSPETDEQLEVGLQRLASILNRAVRGDKLAAQSRS
ncbi:PLP-dependent aminotransferase family protein (plasmid) [Mesorhizobium sp. AR10]|uniref:aminotransferase-like domain-containing protein n=1 Tax=Mesorhizobium sp. AR10 TaxID=2865839 RepID=UPI00215E9B4E|nr:PLP-dependent aminotransferase family protein [Mesorhizobium sp. AR10]UVK35998.1 PLP-dependent aminotransferase family protein [Mesorhizobium sp. AR10]